MALIKKFCCGYNVRSGSIFSGFYCLVSSGLFVGLLCVRYVGYRLVDSSNSYAIAAYATIALFGLLLFSSIALIIGVYMDIQTLFVPWLVISVLCIAEACTVLMWYIISILRNGEQIPEWEILITAFHIVNSILLVYCIVCVISQLQDLMAGKGTRRYYRRRRHLRRQRLPPHITPIPIELLGEMAADMSANPLPPVPGHGPPQSPPPYSDDPPPYDPEGQDNDAMEQDESSEQPIDESIFTINVPNEQNTPTHGGPVMYAGGSHDGNDAVLAPANEAGPSARLREGPSSFHYGDDDAIIPAPMDIPNIPVHEPSPDRRKQKDKKKKKRKKPAHRASDRSPRIRHSVRPPPPHMRRSDGPRPPPPNLVGPPSPQPHGIRMGRHGPPPPPLHI